MKMQDQEPAHWQRAQLFGFRFAFVYLILYNLPFPLGLIPHTSSLAQIYKSLLWPRVVPWVAKHVLRLSYDAAAKTLSSDSSYANVRVLCLLGTAVVAAVLWSLLDRSHSSYPRLHQWLRLYVRLSVGAAMLGYGAAKIFQQQFVQPDLFSLLDTYGETSRSVLLWNFMGASRGYCIFAGCVEMFAGILLFVPRLTTLGSLVGIAVMSNVFAINVFYNVRVKLYSLHLLLMCVFLVLPEAQRLIDFFLLDRDAEPPDSTALFDRSRLNAAALWFQLTLCAFLACLSLYRTHEFEKKNWSIASRPPLYGIWMVDEFARDGKVLPPLPTDEVRWQKMIIEFPGAVAIQSMDGQWWGYDLDRDEEKKTFNMERSGPPKRKFAFAFSNFPPQSLILEGSEGENQFRVKLHRLDETQLPLLRGGLHWIREDDADN